MALGLKRTTAQGVDFWYHRIEEVRAYYSEGRYVVGIGSYRDKEAREEGLLPLPTLEWLELKAEAVKLETPDDRGGLYDAVKQLPEWGGAEDA